MEMMVNPFLVFISNSSEMGHKVGLTPKASLQDGLLDVMIISKIGRLKMIWLGILILFNRPYLLKEVTSFQTKNLELFSHDRKHFDSQIDGELHQLNHSKVSIGISDRALKAIVPHSKNLR